MKECPEGNIQKLADPLTGVKISKKPTSNKTYCTSCGKAGHLNINCWGTCPACNQLGHRPRSCELSVQERRRIERARKRKLRAVLKKRNLKKKSNEPQFDLKLPGDEDDSDSNYWIDSLSNDGETVVGSSEGEREDPQEDSDEEEASEAVMRVKEVIDGVTDDDIKSAMEMIRNAKETDNSAQGLISSNTDFRSANLENFLFDSGASVSIMGEIMARENKLTIRRLARPRNVHEASGAKLDIIGTADMFVKIRAIGKTKKLRCLILRGSNVDREVLISCKMLKRWDLIHKTFPHETVGQYVRQTIKLHKAAAVYEESAIPSKGPT